MEEQFQEHFLIFKIIAFELVAGFSLSYEQNTCDRQSIIINWYYYQFVYSRINKLKFNILQQSYEIYIKYNIIDKIK